MRSISLLLLVVSTASAFVVAPQAVVAARTTAASPALQMVDPSLFDQATTSLMISETDPWVQPLSLVLDPFLNLFSFAMVCCLDYWWRAVYLYVWTPISHSFFCWLYTTQLFTNHLALPHRLELVSSDTSQWIALGHCGLADRGAIATYSWCRSTCVWCWHYTHCLVGNLYLFPRDFVGTTGTPHHEDKVWNLIESKNSENRTNERHRGTHVNFYSSGELQITKRTQVPAESKTGLHDRPPE